MIEKEKINIYIEDSRYFPRTHQDPSILSQDEIRRAQRFRNDSDRDNFLTGRYLARKKLAEILGREPADIILEKTEYGKPFCPGSGIDFNISHSGHRVLLGLSSLGPIGVDIEKIRPVDQELARSCFHSQELDYIFKAGVMGRSFDERFMQIWTLKESYMKAQGQGMHLDLKSIYIEINGESAKAYIDGSLAPFRFFSMKIDDYFAAICIADVATSPSGIWEDYEYVKNVILSEVFAVG